VGAGRGRQTGGRAVDRAYTTLRAAIVAGRYAPATRLTEHEVAGAAGVSRTPAREALRRLEAEGLIEFTPNQGAVVSVWSDEDADELFALRALLEAHGARRAALRASAPQRAALGQLAGEQRREAARRFPDRGRIAELNRRFHRHLADAAASPVLSRTLGSLLEATLLAGGSRRRTAAELGTSAAQHEELVRALEARDAEWAAAIMRAHVLGARRNIEAAPEDRLRGARAGRRRAP
jgi:DNA-binding GntR family transcriptional regulator